MDILSQLEDSKRAVEKETTRLKVRLSHLKLQNRTDDETRKVLEKLTTVEDYIDERIASIIQQHPAYHWFSKVRGVGPENIAKCLGPLRIKPSQGFRKNNAGKLELVDLPFANTISGMWAFSGYAVGDDGKAMKPKEGEVLHYNKELRSLWWRLGTSLLKAGLRQKCSKCGELIGQASIAEHECQDAEFNTVGISAFARYYLREKAKYTEQYMKRGCTVVPASELPKKDGKKYEPEGMISEGHIHNQSLRKMIKLFQACLFLVWREAEGLPPTRPYVVDRLGHDSMINPSEMVDKD